MHAELSPEHSQSSGEQRWDRPAGGTEHSRSGEKKTGNKTRSKREKQNVCLHLKKTASYFVLHLIIRLELLEQANARDRWMGAMGTPLSVPVYRGPFFRYEHGTADTPELSHWARPPLISPPAEVSDENCRILGADTESVPFAQWPSLWNLTTKECFVRRKGETLKQREPEDNDSSMYPASHSLSPALSRIIFSLLFSRHTPLVRFMGTEWDGTLKTHGNNAWNIFTNGAGQLSPRATWNINVKVRTLTEPSNDLWKEQRCHGPYSFHGATLWRAVLHHTGWIPVI